MAIKTKQLKTGILEYGETDPITGQRYESFTPNKNIGSVSTPTSSKINEYGEIINPTQEDIDLFNKNYTTTIPGRVNQPTMGDLGLGADFRQAEEIQSKLESLYGEPNREDIRKSVTDRFQAEIDALNRAAAEQKARLATQYGEIGTSRLGQLGAIQARRGLLGSSFGAAQEAGQIKETQQQLESAQGAVDTALQEKISALNSQARQLESDEYNTKLAAYSGTLKDKLNYINTKGEREKKRADEMANAFILKGFDLTSPENSAYLNEYAKQIGVSPQTLETAYLTAKKASDAAKLTAEREATKFETEQERAQADIERINQSIEADKFKLENDKTLSPLQKKQLETEIKAQEASIAKTYADIEKSKPKAGTDVFQDPNANIIDIMKASAGGKPMSDSTATSLEKAFNVVGQIGDLQNTFSSDKTMKKAFGVDLAPITKIFRSANPYDTKAQAIKAQISAIVPNLARGIYGEVGVLTDNDVALYSRTIPNLGSIEEVRDFVLGATIKSIERSISNKLKVQAGNGKDVSGLEGLYSSVKSQADDLLSKSQQNEPQTKVINGNTYIKVEGGWKLK